MTRRLSEAEWRELASSFAGDCVRFARDRLDRDGFVRLTSDEMASQGSCSPQEAESLLGVLATMEAVVKVEALRCPRCDEALSPVESQGDLCPYCGESFGEHPGGVVRDVAYERTTETGRSAPWVLALHGMATRGAWQEDFNWLVATTYGRSVPVFVYKYGIVRPGVFIKWRQRMLRNHLASKLRRLSRGLVDRALGSRPDVLAHSFGTWLIGHALLEHQDLRVGRVILIGSILPPDFPWNQLQDRGQVEAVVNHYGERDAWAGIACYFIPDSGPSGRRGFDAATGVLNRAEPTYTHSSFFEKEQLRSSYEGLWKPFLQRPSGRLPELGRGGAGAWKKPSLVLRATMLRWALLAIGTAVAAAVTVSLVLGAARLATLL